MGRGGRTKLLSSVNDIFHTSEGKQVGTVEIWVEKTMVRQTNQHLWMTQANDSKYWCCPHKIYIFMLSNWYVVGTMLGMVTNTKRKEPYSRGAGGGRWTWGQEFLGHKGGWSVFEGIREISTRSGSCAEPRRPRQAFLRAVRAGLLVVTQLTLWARL